MAVTDKLTLNEARARALEDLAGVYIKRSVYYHDDQPWHDKQMRAHRLLIHWANLIRAGRDVPTEGRRANVKRVTYDDGVEDWRWSNELIRAHHVGMGGEPFRRRALCAMPV